MTSTAVSALLVKEFASGGIVESVTITFDTLRIGETCPDCGESVYHYGDITLDTDRVSGGLYRLGFDRPRRRSLRDLAIEHRARRAVLGGGHDRHRCPVRPHWTDR